MMFAWHGWDNKPWLSLYLVMAALVILASPIPASAQGTEYIPLFADDFESGVNPAWKQAGPIAGEWGIAEKGGNHFLDFKGMTNLQAGGGPTWTDYVFRIKVVLIEGEAGVRFRQIGGADPGSPIDSYVLQLSRYDLRLYKSRAFRDSSAKPQSVLLGSSPASLVPGPWYSISIDATGNQFTISLDGVPMLKLADSQEPLLFGGIGLIGSFGTHILFDDVWVGRVRAPQAPPQPTPTPMIFPTPLPTPIPQAPVALAQPQTPVPAQEQPRPSLLGLPLSFEALSTIIAALAFLGGLVGWLLTRRATQSKKRRQRKLLNEIDSVYTQFKMNARRCEAELYRLKDIIVGEATQEKISERTYEILDKRLDSYLREIQERIIDDKLGGFPSRLRNSLTRMLEEGAIGEQEFDSIEKLLMATAELSDADKAELKDSLARWRDSYVKKDQPDKGKQ